MKYILSLIISGALVVSGFGQTRNVLVGTNNAVVQPTNFWSADASNARTGLGLGTAATNPASAFQPSSLTLSNLAANNGGGLTNLQATSLVGVIPSSNIATVNFSNLAGTLSIASGGTSATNASDARQNLGSTTVGDAVFIATNAAAARTAIGALASNGSAAGLTDFVGTTNPATARTNLGLGWSALTNTDATNFRNAIGLGTTNNVVFGSIGIGNGDLNLSNERIYWATNEIWSPEDNTFSTPLQFDTTNIAATTRTNLGLPWSGLTNTNAATFQTALFGVNTNPVLVDTNGELVSPTNFWQAAPITTTFIESQPTTNFTTNITAARFLHIHSLNTNIVNVTNTIALPTNGSTYNGDIALVVHQGPTNSMTRVRNAGSTNDIATMTRYNEAIEFVYYNNSWQFNHNEAFTEPIYFAGTNASNNIELSRSNIGLGFSQTVTFGELVIRVGTNTPDLAVDPTEVAIGVPLVFVGTNATVNAAVSRTNLGLPLVALTNTNNATFRDAIELGTTNNVLFSNVTASGTLTATGTVTATTNLVVNGYVDFSTNHTNSNPATNNQIQKFLQIRIGTNAYFLPLYQ